MEEFDTLNSQICEQFFSSLRRISTQITYMNIDNVFYNTRYLSLVGTLGQRLTKTVSSSYVYYLAVI